MGRRSALLFRQGSLRLQHFSMGDGVVLVGLAALITMGVELSRHAPAVIQGPAISLSPAALPWYACFSLGRMAVAYVLSLIFTLIYGHLAVRSRVTRALLLPLLDVLQSIPILSFLPVVLLSFHGLLPQDLAAEAASIVLIFTSQVWNLTFAWYQSLITIPDELDEASTIFRFNGWMRFKTLRLPFAAISLIWNSIMSWAGGWFFLMAAEIFTVGNRDFRLPGLGAYLHEAASQGDMHAIAWGISTLIVIIVALDQFVWRPLLAWSERFKLDTVADERPHTSWFYTALRSSRLVIFTGRRLWQPLAEQLDRFLILRSRSGASREAPERRMGRLYILLGLLGGAGVLWSTTLSLGLLTTIPMEQWSRIGTGLLATMLRVGGALVLALAWTIPAGVAIGTNPRLATLLQPIVQIAASIPATALFPVALLFLLHLPGGINLAAVFLMLMGTQWYLLFNIIAGATAIPQDLKDTATLLGLSRWQRWRILILPSLLPYVVTGTIAASGGAWNASIVAEHMELAGKAIDTPGIGSLIAEATAAGDYPLLLAATLSMVVTVVIINRTLWRRMYRLAEERYRME